MTIEFLALWNARNQNSLALFVYFSNIINDTIKGGSRRAEKSRKVLMMMLAAKLGWAGAVKNSGSKMCCFFN